MYKLTRKFCQLNEASHKNVGLVTLSIKRQLPVFLMALKDV